MAKKTHEELADLFSKRFEDYNTKVLKDIAETIKQFKGLRYTEAHKLAQQLKYNKSYKKTLDELSKLSNKSKEEVSSILEETAKQDIEFNEVYFKARNLEVPIYENNKTLKGIVNNVSKVSGEDFTNIARSSGFVFLDKNKHFKFLNMEQTYHRVIDECVYAVRTGQDTFNNVMRKTINQLIESGVRYITYANVGKKVYTQRIEVAVRRNIMDSIRALNIETSKEIGKRFRYDGIEVTVHLFPAPDHEYVQGHQFRLEEFDKFQNDEDCVDVNGIEYPAVSDETGRDRRSIGQYNCYHSINPIIIGVTKPKYTQEELQKIIDDNHTGVEIDGKHYTLYEATQLQRNIEAEIRKSKDAHIMYKTTDDRLEMLKQQKRITILTQKYNEITKKAKVPDQLKQRSTVSGYRPIKSLKPPREISESIKEPVIKVKKEYKKYDNDTTEFKNNNPSVVLKEKNNIINEWTTDSGGFHTNTGIIKYMTKDKQLYGEHKGWEQGIKDIDNQIKGTLNEDITAYRTVQIPVKELEIGRIVDEEGFIATSLTRSKSVASFNHGDAYSSTIEVKVDAGTRCLYIGDNTGHTKNEEELLFPPEYEIKIISKKREYDSDGDYLRTVFKGKLIKKRGKR